MATINRRITLASRPIGFPELTDFDLIYSPRASPADGELLVRSVYLSLDPYIRRRMNGAESHGGPPVAIGEVMIGSAVGFVEESAHPGFRAGDTVEGMLGWQEYAVAPGRDLRRVDPDVAPISTSLGVLGAPGLTALFGLLDVCNPRRGETVVVSGASSGIGMIAGQIAKIKGCRSVGVADSADAIPWLLGELGFDGAFTCGTAAECDDALAEHCPSGIDVYFDNVGGTITDAVLRRINSGARISICGQLSQCNLREPGTGPRWMRQLMVKGAKVQGVQLSGYAERFPEGLAQLSLWFQQGKLQYREDIAQGLEASPQAFIGMLRGKNQGKQLVQLSEL